MSPPPLPPRSAPPPRRGLFAPLLRVVDDVAGFVRDYGSGLRGNDFLRLFDRDASTAWKVLAERHRAPAEPCSGIGLFLYRARVLFLGLSYRLSPPRRLLFAFTLVALGYGFLSHLFFLVAYAGALFLLVLELVDRIRVRDELEVARTLQRSLLPHELPPLAGWQVAWTSRTAREVGGDYAAVIPLQDGRIAVAVGDASGHGMGAGLLMAIADSTLRTAVELDPDPAAVARLLDRALARIGGRRAFFTLFYALLDPETGRMSTVSAGHPFPMLRRADGRIEELGAGSFPLGLGAASAPPTGAGILEPGDTLLLYSDGFPEGMGLDGAECFGFTRLREVLGAGGSPAELCGRIENAFDAFVGGGEPEDDRTLLVLRRDGAAVTAVTSAGAPATVVAAG